MLMITHGPDINTSHYTFQNYYVANEQDYEQLYCPEKSHKRIYEIVVPH